MGLEEEEHTRFLIFGFDPNNNQLEVSEKGIHS